MRRGGGRLWVAAEPRGMCHDSCVVACAEAVVCMEGVLRLGVRGAPRGRVGPAQGRAAAQTAPVANACSRGCAARQQQWPPPTAYRLNASMCRCADVHVGARGLTCRSRTSSRLSWGGTRWTPGTSAPSRQSTRQAWGRGAGAGGRAVPGRSGQRGSWLDSAPRLQRPAAERLPSRPCG